MKSKELKKLAKELVEGNNTNEYPGVTSAIDASAKLLLTATINAKIYNPEISTVFSIDNGQKYLLRFERIDLD